MSYWDDMSIAEQEETLRESLTTIRRCWGKPDTPRGATAKRLGGGKSKAAKPGSAAPGGAPTVLRASLVQTVAFWFHAALDDEVITLSSDARINLADPREPAKIMLGRCRELITWDQSQERELIRELAAEAKVIERLTREPATGVHIGQCPRERVEPDGSRVVCGGDLWATERNASDVKCPLCGAKDTVEQWQREIIGDLGEMTTEELAEYLTRIGLRQATPGSVRVMAHRKQIPDPRVDPKTGRKVYDVRKVLEMLTDSDTEAVGA